VTAASVDNTPSLNQGDVVAVVHGAWGDSLDEEDTRIQASEVAESLTRLGMTAPIVALGPDLEQLSAISQHNPKVIFNLVEGLGGLGRRAHEAAIRLAQMGIPITGVSGGLQEVVNSKVSCKLALQAAGFPTPPWTTTGTDVSGDDLWIVKPVWEHGSLDMDESSVVKGSEVAAALAKRRVISPHDHFAERYVAGREFNCSVVAGPTGGQVFGAVEMLFVDYPDQGVRIIDYAAKWDAASFGYHHTPRRFEFSPCDEPLLKRLQTIALDVWQMFALEGYVRVDFRVDAENQPWILEVNANPCLSHDAGFVVTVLRSGINYDALIWRLVQAALGWTALGS